MEKQVSKNNMTVVHVAVDENKPIVPFTSTHILNTRMLLDPSSSTRADRYPIPSSFNYRFDPIESDYA